MKTQPRQKDLFGRYIAERPRGRRPRPIARLMKEPAKCPYHSVAPEACGCLC